MNYQRSRKVKNALVIVAVGVVLAMLYPIANQESWNAILNGFLIGFTGSGFVALNEVILDFKFIRKLTFKGAVLYKTMLYFTFFIFIIPSIIIISRAMEAGLSISAFIDQGGLYHYIFLEDFHVTVIYSLFATVVFIFAYQMTRKMGQGILWSFITGKYHQPREEKLIFMIMDMNDSTALAEQLGDIEFTNLLNDFFLEITDSIVNHLGIIYRYVGDEVVVVWNYEKGIRDSIYLRAFFSAKKAISKNEQYFLNRYGVVPSFTASVSSGKVVVSEIGRIKSQITLSGDVLFEVTEIEKQCANYATDILIPQSLLEQARLPKYFEAKKQGEVITSLGKTIPVYSVHMA